MLEYHTSDHRPAAEPVRRRPSVRPAVCATPVPADFVAITEPLGRRIDRDLGYAGHARHVAFWYDPRADDVAWDDGRATGSAGGSWRPFLEVVAPLADVYEANVGSGESVGRDVLLLDRVTGEAWFAPRDKGLAFIGRRNPRMRAEEPARREPKG